MWVNTMDDKDFNVVSLDTASKFGSTAPRVRLTKDLGPESVLEYAESSVYYQAGWEGDVIEVPGPLPFDNYKDCLPVLFDDYALPVWINKQYLELIK